jgi:LysM repeat protein
MSTGGRIVVGVAVVGLLLGGTLVAAHYLMKDKDPAKDPAKKSDVAAVTPPPTVIETPTGTSGIGMKHVAGTGAPAAAEGTSMSRWQEQHGSLTDPSAVTVSSTVGGSAVSPAGTAVGSGAGDRAADEGLSMLRDRPVLAQKRLGEALRAGVDGVKGQQVRTAVNALADAIQFSPQMADGDAYSKQYKVVSGDSLTRIGNGYLIPPELIMRMNHRSSSGIAAGEQIKVLQGPMSVEISKSRKELQLWIGDACVRVRAVAVGANNRTPEGTFTVTKKLKNPPYQPSDKAGAAFKAGGAPDNPLGTRWIEFKKSFGIHGTIDPTSIGKDVSEGCVRMLNPEVEELYDMLVVGSKVTIRP